MGYIIIGAGSAGCILANKLSENPKNTVLLLEAGGSDQKFWIKTPLGYAFTYNDPKVNWRWVNVSKTYQSIEKHVSKKEVLGDGPIQISNLSEAMHPFTKHFMAAAKELNWPEPINTSTALEGLGYVHNTTKNGKRFSSADAFLHPK